MSWPIDSITKFVLRAVYVLGGDGLRVVIDARRGWCYEKPRRLRMQARRSVDLLTTGLVRRRPFHASRFAEGAALRDTESRSATGFAHGCIRLRENPDVNTVGPAEGIGGAHSVGGSLCCAFRA